MIFEEFITIKSREKEKKITYIDKKEKPKLKNLDIEIKDLFSEAKKEYDKAHLKKALEIYDQILKFLPHNDLALFQKGYILAKTDPSKYYKACELFSIILCQNIVNLETRVQRARCLSKIGDFFASKVDYDIAIGLSNDPILVFEQVENLLNMYQYETALSYILEIANSPFIYADEDLKFRFYYLKTLCLFLLGKIDESLKSAKESLIENVPNQIMFELVGEIAIKSKEWTLNEGSYKNYRQIYSFHSDYTDFNYSDDE